RHFFAHRRDALRRAHRIRVRAGALTRAANVHAAVDVRLHLAATFAIVHAGAVTLAAAARVVVHHLAVALDAHAFALAGALGFAFAAALRRLLRLSFAGRIHATLGAALDC